MINKFKTCTTTFLAIFSLALLSGSVFADENIFSSPSLGFKFTKPTTWHFVSANTYLDQMKQIKWDDPGAQEHWNSALRAPIVVVSEFPTTHNGINPSFKVDAKPYGVIPSGLNGQEIVSKLIPMMQQRFKNFRVETVPKETTLGKQKAGHVKVTYITTSSTGINVELSSEIWAIPMKYYVFILGATYAPDSKASVFEIQKIVQSVSIE